MKTFTNLILGACLFGITSVSGLRASEFDKKTIVTFHEAMEIPGMVLPAGNYVIKRADRSLPDVIQFAKSNENHVYATVFALPAYRPEPSDKVVIVTEERPANSPEAIKKWFYPGDTIGAEFVYPKSKDVLMAMAAVPSTTAETAAPAAVPAELSTERPVEAANSSPQPVEVAQSNMPQTPVQPDSSSAASSAQTSPAEPLESSAQDELPQTASNLPLIGLFGMLCVVCGLKVRKLSRRVS